MTVGDSQLTHCLLQASFACLLPGACSAAVAAAVASGRATQRSKPLTPTCDQSALLLTAHHHSDSGERWWDGPFRLSLPKACSAAVANGRATQRSKLLTSSCDQSAPFITATWTQPTRSSHLGWRFPSALLRWRFQLLHRAIAIPSLLPQHVSSSHNHWKSSIQTLKSN